MSRKIVATEYLTLDGFMDEPGQWSMPFFSDEAGAFKFEELQTSDALLLGRRTYEGFAKAWPNMTDLGEFADKMNGMPKYVATRTLTELTWNAHRIEGDLVEGIRKLTEADGGDLLLSGSGQLFNLCMSHDLIDEYRFMIFPYLLGSDGTLPLFTGGPRRTLKLVDTKVFDSGVVVQTYHRA
ncbi:MAG TPA: dihydrofolate reductase family protein [Pseudonocardiaceae bacterium]|jgi:dihydrofolate reductase|nr:dihydrofolate reductase family protein [Pseudonocardiaceae bacterium]